ncbi:hypothetical protein PSECIP111951_04184 [Pseudoalteromonas holothuriae]|uniref:Lipoprotein n=1 Tax=Pseudoalteromonas holothuriae TaxID=2963714 RepID=A0ABM9GP66_9GAMM|nr:hypothetical protein [Pseudoalteromonas sp. CIP111951]CAH9068533.1 hypothetical protein PSECIP111951_04184 [Pseudoalteromonas sp. CIP111951]
MKNYPLNLLLGFVLLISGCKDDRESRFDTAVSELLVGDKYQVFRSNDDILNNKGLECGDLSPSFLACLKGSKQISNIGHRDKMLLVHFSRVNTYMQFNFYKKRLLYVQARYEKTGNDALQYETLFYALDCKSPIEIENSLNMQ